MYRNFGIKEERLIFFGDVLGFKDMIKESEQQKVNSMLTANINEFLDAVKNYLSSYHKKVKVTVISDSVIISAHKDDADEFFKVVAHIYCDYYGLDFILRGAITYGKLYHEENIFGSGYIEAYQLESKEAITPRIIVDEKALQCTKSNNYLIEGKDFKSFNAFLCYLDDMHGVDTARVNCWLNTIERYINEAHKNDGVKKSKKIKILRGLRWLLKTLENAVKQIDCDKYNKDIKKNIATVFKKARMARKDISKPNVDKKSNFTI